MNSLSKVFLHFLSCALFLSLITFVSLVSASSVKIFTIGVEDYENWLPYSSYKNGVYFGLGKDILDAFAKEQGYVFQYKVLPLKRRDKLFTSGQLDFIFPDHPLWVADLKQDKQVHYAAMLEFIDGTVVLRNNVGKGVENIKVLGLPLGFTPAPYFDLIEKEQIKIEEWSSYDGIYQGLINNRLDAAYMNTRIANYYWKNKVNGDALSPVVADMDLPYIEDYWYFSSIRYPSVVEEFQSFIKKNEKLINALKLKYQFD